MREQKAKESSKDSSTIIAGIDPVLHHNMVAELRGEISNLKEQLSLNGNATVQVTGDLESNNHARSKRAVEHREIIEKQDQSTSTEDLSVLEARLYDEKLENWEFEEDEAVKKDEVISNYDDFDEGFAKSIAEIEEMLSNKEEYEQQAEASSSNIKVADSNESMSQAVQQELVDVQKALQSQELKEEEAVDDILGQDVITNTGEQVDTNNSTTGHKEVLEARARIAARARDNLHFSSKAVSKQIRHRLLTREIGSMVAVAAGDEDQATSYSVWSSGVFGSSKQKDSSTILGYSSRIRGGSVGAEINFSNDLMFGVSYSRLASNVKYLSMLNSDSTIGKFVKSNTDILSIYSNTTLGENIKLHSLGSIALSQNSKDKNIFKPESKLFSFESHLNYKLALEGKVILIPSLGFRYEYERVGASREQILDSYILHHNSSKSNALSGELGSRVLFTPINLSSDFKLIPTIHISLEKRIASTGEKRGQLSIKDIGGEATVVSGSANHEKLSTNIGGGLIASHQNMSLEFLYDLQKQRSFKSHQGILKLKVNL